jgi:small redox-active disulfide protein 2
VKVQVLGTGCPKCKRLVDNVRQAIEEADLDVEVEKVEDIKQIIAFGVMLTPALAVDGEVKSSGKVLSADDIRKLLEG